jgi:CDP-diacylglycerol--serine O-phosphatidyltransferase
MASLLLFYSLRGDGHVGGIGELMVGIIFIFYIISGLRRLIEFNLKVDAGEVEKYFEGVPTPLGAILLWVLYLLYSYGLIGNPYLIAFMVIVIAWALNSKLKIRHP